MKLLRLSAVSSFTASGLLFVTVALAAACGGAGSAPHRVSIAVIPKGTSHVFWQSVHAGARRAANELDVDITWRGPLREDDRDSQVGEVENAVARHVSGIALAPLDESALVAPVASAGRSGVPVVIFDSGLKGDGFISFVATDNDKGGELAGEHLAKALGGRGKVILLRYAEGHDSTTRREEGFLRGVRAHPDIEILSSNQYAGADVEGGYKRAEALLSRFKATDGSLAVDGIFAPNESSAFAVMRVLKDNGWAGRVKFVGFDVSDGLLAGLRDGAIEALVVQDPVRMGYLSVVTLVQHLRGQKVEPRIDTGVHLVTREMLDRPEVQQLVHPDLTR
jgi:ribose transport system substrate-binding protein